MSNALATAVTGITKAVAQATHATASIVKASSTGAGIDKNLVKIKQASVAVAAEAKVIKTEQKNQKSLIDITV